MCKKFFAWVITSKVFYYGKLQYWFISIDRVWHLCDNTTNDYIIGVLNERW